MEYIFVFIIIYNIIYILQPIMKTQTFDLILILLSFNLIAAFAQSDKLYKLNLIPQTGNAACLDGSAPGYYIHEGLG